jgi:speckle-type POZ protein
MLHFMYLFDYNASGSDQAPASPIIFNVKVYSIVDKYDVPMLKS